jgi:hypothetical protein
LMLPLKRNWYRNLNATEVYTRRGTGTSVKITWRWINWDVINLYMKAMLGISLYSYP